MNFRINLLNVLGLLAVLTSIIYFLYVSQKAIKKRKKLQENEIKKEDSPVFQILQNDLSELENETLTESQVHIFEITKTKLLRLMKEEKPYQDSDITLHKLAKCLNTDSASLSYIINKDLNQNFVNFINEYRVEEMKRFLQDGSLNFTFKALLQNSGFKSKSAVNLAFKKSTGMTLSNYLKSIQTVEV